MNFNLFVTEMAHEGASGPDGSPQQTPSPPHPSRVPLENSFHQQIMQVGSFLMTNYRKKTEGLMYAFDV